MRVCWLGTNGESAVEAIKSLEVVDRAFLHGDVVARASDALGQSGCVTGIHLSVDLEWPNGEKQNNVTTRRIRHIRQAREKASN